MFGWLVLIVYDRKFSAGIIFFSHTNQPAVLLHEPVTIQTSQPNRLHVATMYQLCADIGEREVLAVYLTTLHSLFKELRTNVWT